MTSRPGLAVTGAITLTLAVGSLFWWQLWQPHPSQQHRILKKTELLSLPTYDRHCDKTTDCKPPLHCVSDFRIEDNRCLASECSRDLDCESGFLCRAVPSRDGKPIHLCVIEGIKGEGEQCWPFPVRRRDSCRPGLVCNYGYCGRPCQLDAPSSCPSGQICFDDLIVGPSCIPSCNRTGCGPGKRCFVIEGEHSVCGSLLDHAQDCERTPCAGNQRCQRSRLDDEGHLDMWCELPCDDKMPCTADRTCMNGACLKPCKDGDAGACGPHEECIYYPMPMLWLCTRR